MRFFCIVILLLTTQVFVFAQTPPSGLSGSSLRSWLKTNFYNGQHNQLGYTSARRYMYNDIDNQNNKITCVYSGYQKSWSFGGTGTNPYPINCEHTVPQSFFGQSEPTRSDIHHLFPTYANWNSARSNYPFKEIADNTTTKWMFNTTSQSNTPTSNIDAYSEQKSSSFEPREDHKGNIARAVFYFFTMYPTQAGSINSVGDPNLLYQWHTQDPVDAEEAQRNNKIETYQGNRNPYVDHPEWIALAWGFSSPPNPPSGGGADLMISEYVEGSSNNKALEIANTTSGSINLSGYTLKKQTNGSGSWGSTYTLSGTLAAGDVFVISNSSATSTLKNKADVTTSSGIMTFNGNDPIGLFKNNALIDIVGTYNGGSSSFAANKTLVRKATVSSPNTTYTTGEWSNYAQNTFTYVGSHNGGGTTNPPASNGATDLFFSEYVEGSSYNKALEIANFTGSNVSLSAYSIKKQSNGSGSWGSAYNLSGTLSQGNVFVIAHSSATSTLKNKADVTTSNSIVSFNGNDPVGLFKNGVLIDIIGTYNGGSSYFASNKTLVRKSSVSSPSTSYQSSQWTVYSQNTYTYVGSHSFSSSRVAVPLQQSLSLSVYPNPFVEQITVAYELAQSGDVQIVMYDITGQIVYTQTNTQLKGVYQLVVPTDQLAKGAYVLSIKTDQQLQTKTVIK